MYMYVVVIQVYASWTFWGKFTHKMETEFLLLYIMTVVFFSFGYKVHVFLAYDKLTHEILEGSTL